MTTTTAGRGVWGGLSSHTLLCEMGCKMDTDPPGRPGCGVLMCDPSSQAEDLKAFFSPGLSVALE